MTVGVNYAWAVCIAASFPDYGVPRLKKALIFRNLTVSAQSEALTQVKNQPLVKYRNIH